jgi:maltose alpha-D-glucosyltransferase/alpha-amylase
MAFHFPLMPRMFMALKREDRHPITEILRQTPEIPDGCQWVLFLRNHDELTLEMVNDEERDYLYASYAADPQMRLNRGIRRRLAPLLDNDRGRIQLLHSLLMSLPGTPVLYYGDELGMGDNIYLGDRNGVRTPMQWTGDRNGGFSRADPARLFAPPIMDPVYGYQAVNVEAQERSPSSLLNWFRRIVALRRGHRTFGRGSMRVLFPRNRKVLAFVRQHEHETILVVANLARSAQPAELDLSEFNGLTPIEMLDRTEFPRIGELPYFLTLAPHQFYWFRLEQGLSPITAMEPLRQEDVDSLPILMAGPAWETLFDGHVRTLVEQEGLPAFLRRQRWFGGKARSIARAVVGDWLMLTRTATPTLLAIVDVDYEDGPADRYFVPMALIDGAEADSVLRSAPEAVVARIGGARDGVLCDATVAGPLARLLLEAIRDAADLDGRRGRIGALPDGSIASIDPAELEPIVRAPADQSNTSLIYGRRLLLKLFRRMEAGQNPDYEIPRHLARQQRFDRLPPLVGGLEYRVAGSEPTTLAVLQGFVESQADGWRHALDELARYYQGAVADAREGHPAPPAPYRPWDALDRPPPDYVRNTVAGYLECAATLGRRTAELHLALAAETGEPAFDPEPLDAETLHRLAAAMCAQAESAATLLEARLDALDRETRPMAETLLARRLELLAQLQAFGRVEAAVIRSRVHGDYHLGQLLWVEDDYVVLDFEGEPARTLEERRAKQSPLKDVGGMVRSFAYAAHVALRTFTRDQPHDEERLREWARAWHVWVAASFLREYRRTVQGTPIIPADAASCSQLLLGFTLDKAVYEVLYELNSRPEWVRVPLSGIVELLGGEDEEEA